VVVSLSPVAARFPDGSPAAIKHAETKLFNSMHQVRSFFAPDRYSAKKTAVPINFVCVALEAKQVYLTGDFNDWDPVAHPMKRQPDGAWLLQVQLNHGHHHYRFLVDGKPVLDPRAQGIARDHQGAKVSLIAVS
jgi:1,4-alpha-glucan branching enzyme